MSKELPTIVSPRSIRRIIQLASNCTLFALQNGAKADIDTEIRNARNIIARAKYLKPLKLQRTQFLIEQATWIRRENDVV